MLQQTFSFPATIRCSALVVMMMIATMVLPSPTQSSAAPPGQMGDEKDQTAGSQAFLTNVS